MDLPAPAPTDSQTAAPRTRDAIIACAVNEVREGATLREVSAKHNVPASTINGWLLSRVPEEYREAQEAGVVARLAEQAEKLENATSHLEVARARETARYWCWISERLLPRFATKQEISGPGGGPIQVEDRELARRYAFIQQMVKYKAGIVDAEVITTTPTSRQTAPEYLRPPDYDRKG